MHSFCVIIAAFGSTLGFALLLAGFVSLVGPDEEERVALRQRFAAARKRGALSEQMELIRVRGEYTSIARCTTEWSRRIAARRMISVGVASIVVAIIAGLASSRWPESAQRSNQSLQLTAARSDARIPL